MKNDEKMQMYLVRQLKDTVILAFWSSNYGGKWAFFPATKTAPGTAVTFGGKIVTYREKPITEAEFENAPLEHEKRIDAEKTVVPAASVTVAAGVRQYKLTAENKARERVMKAAGYTEAEYIGYLNKRLAVSRPSLDELFNI